MWQVRPGCHAGDRRSRWVDWDHAIISPGTPGRERLHGHERHFTTVASFQLSYTSGGVAALRRTGLKPGSSSTGTAIPTGCRASAGRTIGVFPTPPFTPGSSTIHYGSNGTEPTPASCWNASTAACCGTVSFWGGSIPRCASHPVRPLVMPRISVVGCGSSTCAATIRRSSKRSSGKIKPLKGRAFLRL